MKTVQLLGKGRSVGPDPPFPPGVERWGISDLIYRRYNGQFDDWTRWFDVHPVEERILKSRPATWAWYQQQDGRRPIYLLAQDPSVPGSVGYPRDAIQAAFADDGAPEDLFGSSLDLMLALATHEGFERIELVWFRMRDGVEYEQQRPSALYWIGRARGRGIQVVIHGDSSLKDRRGVYGFEYLTPLRGL